MGRTEPRPSERTERYLAIPCSGNLSIGNELEHIWKVLDYEHPSGRVTFRGWLPRETILRRFGKSVYFSGSHGACSSCYQTFIKE